MFLAIKVQYFSSSYKENGIIKLTNMLSFIIIFSVYMRKYKENGSFFNIICFLVNTLVMVF